MQIFDRLRRLPNILAPQACSFCDGGSGIVADERMKTLRRCDACDGTGLANGGASNEQELVDTAIGARRSRRPSNVA
jgi:hypothetical protein